MLSNYARKIAAGKVLLSDKLKYTVLIFSIAGVHTALIFLFLYMQVYPMVIFNIASAVMYLLCGGLIRREHYFPVLFITFLEIIIHSFVATLFIGWQYGFPLYIVALVPCAYYVMYTLNTGRRRILTSTILALISFISFVGCRILALFITPVYQAKSELFVSTVYIFNAICTYIFLIFFSISFILKIQNFAGKMTKQNSMLEELANVDPLTGLFNRRYVNKYIEEIMRKKSAMHIMMCDIDDFKKLNDSYGHDFGDTVLKGVSAIVQEEIKDRGYAFRWGGEEILVLCDSPDTEKARARAENIRKKLDETIFDCYGKPVHCTLTIGVFRHTSGDDIEKTISRADKNLYIGKGRGKNVVIL